MTGAESFWLNVQWVNVPPPVEELGPCWTWSGGRYPTGYGRASDGTPGGQTYAHRRAWELTRGRIPDGLFVCHACDNRLCVRPDHLFLGTAAENNADRDRKGRTRRHVPDRTRPTDRQLQTLAEYVQSGATIEELAARRGISASSLEQQLASSRRRLGAVTTAQAYAFALARGLIATGRAIGKDEGKTQAG